MNFYKFQLYEIYSLDSYVKGSSVTLRTLKRVPGCFPGKVLDLCSHCTECLRGKLWLSCERSNFPNKGQTFSPSGIRILEKSEFWKYDLRLGTYLNVLNESHD